MRARLLLSEAWHSLGSNLSTTFAATMTVLVSMFLLGLFVMFGSWTLSLSDYMEDQLIVKVSFTTTPEATKAEKNAVARVLSSNPHVDEVTFVPKEKAFEVMKKRHPELLDKVPWNPFPDVLQVKPTKAEYVQEIVASLTPKPAGVMAVDDEKKLSRKVLQTARVIQAIVTIAAVVLLAAATLLIANTIRLSIFSRRREVEVMKLVGATNWFVRGPFMIEGLIFGVGGALISILLLALGRAVVQPTMLGDAFESPEGVQSIGLLWTATIMVGAGLALGALGSGLTIRRFLKV